MVGTCKSLGSAVTGLGFDNPNRTRFGARVETEAAPGTLRTGVESRMIAGRVQFLADGDHMLGAFIDTELATLAELRVDLHERHVNCSLFSHGNHLLDAGEKASSRVMQIT